MYHDGWLSQTSEDQLLFGDNYNLVTCQLPPTSQQSPTNWRGSILTGAASESELLDLLWHWAA